MTTQMLNQNLIDELILIQSDKEIGKDGLDFIDKRSSQPFSQIIENFILTKTRKSGKNDLIKIFQKSD